MVIPISVEVHCLQWSSEGNNRYRLYVNDELMVERDWLWGEHTFIVENLIVDLVPDTDHVVRVEIVRLNPQYLTYFRLDKLVVNDQPQPIDDNFHNTIAFRI